jgi:hypothetical protein
MGRGRREPEGGVTEKAPKTENRQSSRLATFASQNPVAVVSWIGAVAYFVTRMAQTSFYSKFGLEPEDVGLGYAQTLSRAAALLLLISLVTVVWLAASTRHRARGPLILAAGRLAVWTLVVLALWMPLTYTRDAHRVKEGKALRPAGLSTPNRIVTNPLGLRVEPVRVSWIDKARAAHDFGSDRVVYLGRAEGIAVFYDAEKRQTVRVPEGDIVIERTG